MLHLGHDVSISIEYMTDCLWMTGRVQEHDAKSRCILLYNRLNQKKLHRNQ